MGIPYAKPPVGELRWKAPEPLPTSEAVFEAWNFGASAIQVDHEGSIAKHYRQIEDCLTLNIVAGTQNTEEKKPVLVLFHHGDFTSGSAVDLLLYGDRFVGEHQYVVCVTFNYRLGILGFIDFSEVPGAEAYSDTLNLGLLDQIAALKWIKENIAAFGGDPDRITVLGFTSGATCICLLAASEQAKGLFQRAFVIGGGPDSAYRTPEYPRALAKGLLKETHTSTMAELLQLDTETLKDAAQRLWKYLCAPTCDGTLVPTQVYRSYKDGAASDIEFIVGITGSETQVFRSIIGSQKYEEAIAAGYVMLLSHLDDSTADAIKDYLEIQKAASSELEAKSKLIEQCASIDIYRVAAKLLEGGSKVHMMYWNEKALIENLGSGGIDVLATLLGNDEALQMYGGVLNADLSEVLQSLLQKFITGDTLQLYRNEIACIDSLDWKAFPQALVISDGRITCDTIEDKIIDVDGLLSYIVSS